MGVGVGLSCNPPGPREGGSGHRRQAAALPPSEEERFSHGAAPGSESPLVLAVGYPRNHPRKFLGGERNGREKRKGIDAERKAWTGVPFHQNAASGKRKGEKGKSLAMFKSP